MFCTHRPTSLRSAPQRRVHRRLCGRAAGFTLIETALTTIIIGTGVLAIVAAQQTYVYKNDWAQRTGLAMMLANELRELTLSLPAHDPLTHTTYLGPEPGENSVADFDDLDDFAGVVVAGYGEGTTFDPPINAMRVPIPNLDGWRQHITVENVLPQSIDSTFSAPLGSTDMMRITVTVDYKGPRDTEPMVVTQTTWVIAR